MAKPVNTGKFAHTLTKKTQPTTSMVDPHGVSQAKSGTGAKFDSTIFNKGKAGIGPAPTDQGKSGTGGTLDFGMLKGKAKESITSSAISAAK